MRFLFSLSIAAVSSATSALGAIALYDDFTYPNGALTTESGGTWSAFSSAGTLPVQVTGGTISLVNVASGGSGEDIRKALDTSYSTGVLYYSALITPTATTTSANGDYFFSGYSSAGSGGGFFGRVFLSTTATGITFGLSNGSSTPTDWTSDVTLNTQYLVVVRLDIAARTATMGVFNPSSAPTSDAQLTVSGGAASGTTGAIDYVAFRQGSGTAFSNSIDGVAVSTSITEVIPEPASALLGAVGILGILRRRR